MGSHEDVARDIYVGKVCIPSLSSLLDVRVPVVELEADRLHSAVSWLYGAVEALQEQSRKLSSELQRLQETTRAQDLQAHVPAAAAADAEDLRLLLWQQEQRRSGEEARLDVRLDALSAAVEGRLRRADLEALEEKVMGRLGQITQESKQDLASLTRLLEGSISAERRQLQESFESLCRKVDAHLDVLLSEAGVTDDQVQAAVAAAAKAAAQQPVHKEPSLSAPEETAPPESRHSGLVDMHLALQSRLEQLERSVQLLSQRESVGAGYEPLPPAPDAGKSGNEAAMWQRFTDMDQAHIMNVQRISELETRLARMEGRRGPARGGSGKAAAQEGGDWEAPVSELQSSHASLAEEVSAHLLPQVSTLRSTLTQITKYISGESDMEEGGAKSATAPGWLQQRVGAIGKDKGLPLETRLQLLEEATGSTEIFKKVQNLEHILGKLDVDAVNEVPPQLIIVKEDQEVFKQDLRREVQELKVLVGCMEACVPKETRKAIQLFKRGAGVSDEELITAGGLKLQADLEALREDLQSRLTDVEGTATQQCDNLGSVVQELEAKQEKLYNLVRRGRFASEEASVTGVDSGFVAPEGWKPPVVRHRTCT